MFIHTLLFNCLLTHLMSITHMLYIHYTIIHVSRDLVSVE